MAWCLERGVPVLKAFPLMLLRGTRLERERRRWGLVENDDVIPAVVRSNTFDEGDWQWMAGLSEALRMTEGRHPPIRELRVLAGMMVGERGRFSPVVGWGSEIRSTTGIGECSRGGIWRVSALCTQSRESASCRLLRPWPSRLDESPSVLEEPVHTPTLLHGLAVCRTGVRVGYQLHRPDWPQPRFEGQGRWGGRKEQGGAPSLRSLRVWTECSSSSPSAGFRCLFAPYRTW